MNTGEYHYRQILKVVGHIDSHLDEELTLDALSRVAGYSSFHFSRVFKSAAGVSLNEFIRRLRLNKAATELRKSCGEVTYVAMSNGYDSPSAFTRAFKAYFGQTPNQYRRATKTELHYELIQVDPMEVGYIEATGPYVFSTRVAWEQIRCILGKYGIDVSHVRCLGYGLDNPASTPAKQIRYRACIVTPKVARMDRALSHEWLGGGRYAVFTHVGEYNRLKETQGAITHAFPTTLRQWYDGPRMFGEYLHMGQWSVPLTHHTTKTYCPVY